MKILFLTHGYPFPARYGGHVYTGNVLRELAKSDFQLKVFTFKTEKKQAEELAAEGIDWTCCPRKKASAIAQIFSPYPAISVKNATRKSESEFRSYLTANLCDGIIIDRIAIGWHLAPSSSTTPGPARSGIHRTRMDVEAHFLKLEDNFRQALQQSGNSAIEKSQHGTS